MVGDHLLARDALLEDLVDAAEHAGTASRARGRLRVFATEHAVHLLERLRGRRREGRARPVEGQWKAVEGAVHLLERLRGGGEAVEGGGRSVEGWWKAVEGGGRSVEGRRGRPWKAVEGRWKAGGRPLKVRWEGCDG